MKEAVIKIIDRHVSDDEEYSCELTTNGFLEYGANGYTVTYFETDEELKGSKTVLKVSGNTIVMTRSGKYNTELIIEKEKRRSCFYETPYGELMMGVYTKNISSKMNENGGKLCFSYTIDFNNDLASENDLTVEVAVKSDDVPKEV